MEPGLENGGVWVEHRSFGSGMDAVVAPTGTYLCIARIFRCWMLLLLVSVAFEMYRVWWGDILSIRYELCSPELLYAVCVASNTKIPFLQFCCRISDRKSSWCMVSSVRWIFWEGGSERERVRENESEREKEKKRMRVALPTKAMLRSTSPHPPTKHSSVVLWITICFGVTASSTQY